MKIGSDEAEKDYGGVLEWAKGSGLISKNDADFLSRVEKVCLERNISFYNALPIEKAVRFGSIRKGTTHWSS